MKLQGNSIKKLSFILFSMFFLASCVLTPRLWGESSRTSDEWITAFAVAPNEKMFIAAGEKYAYIFEVSSEFVELMILSREVIFSPKITKFSITSKGEVIGEISLSIFKQNLSPEALNKLIDLGFAGDDPMISNYLLKGGRFELESNTSLIRLDKKYHVAVIEESSTIANLGKIAITPATIVMDTAITAGVVAVFPLVIVLFTLFGEA